MRAGGVVGGDIVEDAHAGLTLPPRWYRRGRDASARHGSRRLRRPPRRRAPARGGRRDLRASRATSATPTRASSRFAPHAPTPCSTSPRSRRSPTRGVVPDVVSDVNVGAARATCSTPSPLPRPLPASCSCPRPRSTAPCPKRDQPIGEDTSAPAALALRVEQARRRGGRARASSVDDGDRASVPAHRSRTGRAVRDRLVRRTRSRRSSAATLRRSCASATSRRAATSRTCVTSRTPTSRCSARPTRAATYNVCHGPGGADRRRPGHAARAQRARDRDRAGSRSPAPGGHPAAARRPRAHRARPRLAGQPAARADAP